MIPKEILKQIRRIQITTSRMVTDVFAGQYKSVFKGRGMEFEEVREYQPGDDIRFIDWNVTARLGHPYIKKFVEERELTVMFLVDVSLSMHFGTVSKLKSQIAAEVCAFLALSAIKSNDKVGLIIFSDRIEKFIPPYKGLRHILRIIREILYLKPQGKATDIIQVLEYLNKICKRRSVVFIISDFFAQNYKRLLSITNRRHEVVAIVITDPREVELPSSGIIEFVDPESREVFLVDSRDTNLRDAFRKKSLFLRKEREQLFRSIGVDNIEIFSDRPYIKELIKFFRVREKSR